MRSVVNKSAFDRLAFARWKVPNIRTLYVSYERNSIFSLAYRLPTSVCTTKIMLFLSIFQIFNELFLKKSQLFSQTVEQL